MSLNIFGSFDKPAAPGLRSEAVSALTKFIGMGFGASEWITLYGGARRYYFNLDKAYSAVNDTDLTKRFHDTLAEFLVSAPGEAGAVQPVKDRWG